MEEGATIGALDRPVYLEGHGDLVNGLIMKKKMETAMYYLGFRVMGT